MSTGMLVGVGVVAAYLLGLLCGPLGRRWLVWWHGEGEAHQYQFYRCHGCRRIVTHFHVRTGGCRCGESIKVSPARLTWHEKARLLYLPWTVRGLRRRMA